MARLGQHLISQGLITSEQLDEALQHQALYGARLGTNLVDLSMISMSELAQQLSSFHRAPLPPREWVTKPHREAVKTCNRGLVERLRFVPMRLEGKTLHTAVLDPNDPGTLDDLRFATSCRVKAYVLPELAMHDLLARLWNVPRGIRPVDVDGAQERLDAARQGGVDPQAGSNPLQDPRELDLSSWEHNQPAGPQKPATKPQPATRASTLGRPQHRSAGRRAAGARPRRQQTAPVAAPVKPSGSPAPVPAVSTSTVPEPPHGRADPPPATGPVETVSVPPVSTLDRSKQLAAVMRGGMRGRATAPEVQVTQSNLQQAAPISAPVTEGTSAPPVSNLATQLASIVPDPMPEENALPEPPREPTPTPRPEPMQPTDLGVLEAKLVNAETRDELIEAAMDIACHFAPRAALFVVHQGTIQGAQCRIFGSPHQIDGILFPVESDSMLARVAASGGDDRVSPSERAFDKRLLAMLGESTPEDAGVFAVSIKKRVVNVLYVDQVTTKVPATTYAATAALAESMAQAYEALILRRKGG